MVVKIDDTRKVEPLFGNCQETLILSCLQKIIGDFCFLTGIPNKELVQYKPEGINKNFIIMVPQNNKWAELIASTYGNKAKMVKRYAMKKEGDIFNREKLWRAVHSLSSEYSIKLIDEDIFNLCKSNDWSKDLVSQFSDYEMYKKLGIGVAIIKEETLIAGASSYTRYLDGIEIQIDTKQDYRRKGLAYTCGAKLILECLKKGLYPSWDAQNRESVALAEKLGYHFDYEYVAFEINGYSSSS